MKINVEIFKKKEVLKEFIIQFKFFKKIQLKTEINA